MFQDGSGRWLASAADPRHLARERPLGTAPRRPGTEDSPGPRHDAARTASPAPRTGQVRRASLLDRAATLARTGPVAPRRSGVTLPGAVCPPPSRSRPSSDASAPSRRPATRVEAREGPRSRDPVSGPPESDRTTRQALPFASRRFHVLFNSLSKVLFNFPSRYLFAIGLVTVFSLRWSLPPALGCIPKQPDSGKTPRARASRRQGPDTRYGMKPRSEGRGQPVRARSEFHTPQFRPLHKRPDSALGSSRFTRRY